jgi:hypothetical protein
MEIETQRQSAFFLFVGHGNRFVEEILAPPLFMRFGPHEETPSQSPSRGDALLLFSWLHSSWGRDLMSYRQKE